MSVSRKNTGANKDGGMKRIETANLLQSAVVWQRVA